MQQLAALPDNPGIVGLDGDKLYGLVGVRLAA
jgi:hypothetical protein